MAPCVCHYGAMNLTPYVDSLRREFLLAAEAAGEENLGVAERLVPSLDASVRLTLLNALSTAADEISRDLAPGSVDLRLRGLEPSFVVTRPTAGIGFDDFLIGGPAAGNGMVIPAAEDEGAPARINFRPPEHLKARIEEAAGREGLSVNAWLVRAVTATLNGAGRSERRAPPGDHYNVGWVR
jgi:hypothetical protein